MWRRTWIVVVLISLAGCGATAARQDEAQIAGTWRLDAALSDEPRGLAGPDRNGSPRGPRQDSPFRDSTFAGRAGRGVRGRMPELLRIEQSPDRVRLLDSTGVVLQDIATGGAASNPTEDDVVQTAGSWKQGTLTVERTGRRSARTQTFTLEENGGTLVIRTHAARDSAPGFDLKRVYRRVTS